MRGCSSTISSVYAGVPHVAATDEQEQLPGSWSGRSFRDKEQRLGFAHALFVHAYPVGTGGEGDA
jgi:hypothetical protein